MKHILRCKKCNIFTIKETCRCGGKAISTKPGKFSPHFRHKDLRREAREEPLTEAGLL